MIFFLDLTGLVMYFITIHLHLLINKVVKGKCDGENLLHPQIISHLFRLTLRN